MLKAFTIATISSIALGSISIAPVFAETNPRLDTSPSTRNNSNSLAPQQLLKLARQGRFQAKGIPSYSSLNSAIKSGRVTAQSLVSAAIADKRLPETALEDIDYLSAIDKHLKSGGCGSL